MRRFDRPLAVLKGVIGAIFKRSLYTAGVLLSVILLIQLYYIALPGSWFLRSKDITIQTAQAGQDVPFDWCRQPLHGNIYATATRTFYRRDDAGTSFRTVSEYTFNLTIEKTPQDCNRLKISAKRQPQVDGIYYFVTDLKWTQAGHEKSLRFTSNQYSLIATADSLQNRINELEDEVDTLNARLRALLGSTSIVPSSAQTQPSSPTQESTPPAQTIQPTTSLPPTPDQPVVVQQPSLLQVAQDTVRHLLQSATSGLRGTL